MQLQEIKTEVKNLAPEDRRRLALYILELEKERIQEKIGPQIAEDIDGLSKVVQETFEKIRKGFTSGV
jgi:hypothetical protein